MATGNFWNYCGQRLVGLCLFREVGYRISPPKKLAKALFNILLVVKTE